MNASNDTPNQLAGEPDSAWFRRMHALDRFDERWQTAGEATIAEFLPAEPGDERRELLIELIKVDLEYRWRRGERTHIEGYLQQFPELGDAATLPLELIVEELHVRANQNCPAPDDELTARFPDRVTELRAALECGDSSPLSKNRSRQSNVETVLPTDQCGDESPHSKGDGTRSVPATLGRYELREQVGRGGFATVWRAYDPELRREVAIKVPRPELIEAPGFRERIEREVQAAARLKHPAIVPIYEVGHTNDGSGERRGGGTTFIVYEFITGPTLAKLLEQTRPSPRQAAEWIAVLGEALDYAHQSGVVHRDVKPANVMMREVEGRGVRVEGQKDDQDGSSRLCFSITGAKKPESAERTGSVMLKHNLPDYEPMLADFGLALHADAGATLTQQGDILGTPAYMSPEQARGEGHDADARTDVYGLGVMLYEMLAGRRPFEGSGASVLQRVIDEEPPALRSVRPDLPLDLETICQRAMAKELSRRYTSAGAMAADLRAWLEHRPIRARRVGSAERFALWCRRKPALAATIAVAAVISLAVATVSFWRVVEERNRFRAERDRAQTNLYDALISDASAQMAARRTGWWWKAMDDLRQAALLDVPGKDRSHLRELAIECLGTGFPCMRLSGEWPGHDGPVNSVAFSRDGRFAASGGRDQTVRFWSVPEGRPLAVFTGHDMSVLSVAFHPSGDRLASSDAAGVVRVWDLGVRGLDTALDSSESDSGRSQSPLTPSPLPPPRGERGRGEGAASVMHVPRTFDLGPGPVRQVEYSPDGAWLAATSSDGTVRLLPADELAEPRVLTGHTADVLSLAFYRGGDMLVSGSSDLTLRVWNVATGRTISSWKSPTESTPNTVAADRGFLAFWGISQGFGVESKRLNRDEVFTVNQLHSGLISQIEYGSRHNWLLTASADGEIRLSPAEQRVEQAVAGSDHAVRSARFGPGDGWVVAGYQDGQVRLWEVFEPAERTMQSFGIQQMVFVGADRRTTNGAQVWDLSAGLDVTPQAMGDAASAVACHPDGRHAYCGFSDGTIHVWDLGERRELSHWVGHELPIGHVARERGELAQWMVRDKVPIGHLTVSPDGKRLATGGWEGIVKIWDIETQQLERTIDAGTSRVHELAWSGDGATLVVAGKCGTVLVSSAGEPIAWVAERFQYGAADCAVACEGATIAVGTPDGVIELRSAATGEVLRILSGHLKPVRAVRFSADGRRLASVSTDRTVRLWDVETGREQAKLDIEALTPIWLAFDPRGQFLAVADSSDSIQPSIWNISTLQRVATLDCYSSVGVPSFPSMGGQFTPDGKSVLIAVPGGIYQFDLAPLAKSASRVPATGAPVSPPNIEPDLILHESNHQNRIWGVASSPDGRWLATAAHDRLVKIWDARTLRVVHTLRGHGSIGWAVAFSPDSRTLASGSADTTGKVGEIKLWDVETGRQIHHFSGHGLLVYGLDFHPSGKLLASSSADGSIHLWDTERLEPLGELHKFDRAVYSVAFRPDGGSLAASSLDNQVAVWDVDKLRAEGGEWRARNERRDDATSPVHDPSGSQPSALRSPPHHLLTGHTAAVYSVGWSPDGRFLASGSEQGVVMLWNGSTFEKIVTLKGGTGQIRDISFSRDGELLACGAYANPAIVWDIARLRRTLREMKLDW